MHPVPDVEGVNQARGPVAARERTTPVALPDAELVVLPGCAHEPWREDAGEYVAALRRFLLRSGGTTGGGGRV